MIRVLRSLGKTILLTTHYLDEAQQLADRVAVIQAGEIVSIGTPAELIGDSQSVEVRFVRDGEPVVIATEDPTLYELTEALASVARSSSSRCAAPRWRTSTWSWSPMKSGTPNEDARSPADV